MHISHRFRVPAFLILCLVLCTSLPTGTQATAAGETLVFPQIKPGEGQPVKPLFCVVVRTYWGHGRQSMAGLKQLVASLQRQTLQAWEALLVVMDSKPFDDLPRLLQSFQDERVWVYAELIGKAYTPRIGGEWTEGYHGRLYNLTDEAIRACPASTKWVVVTNGDNEYASTFLQRVANVPHADAVAFDYYSRYQRSTGRPCERFAADEGAPLCKQNKMQWCHTDLGANAFKQARLLAEDRRFGAGADSQMAADHFDGAFAQSLQAAGWRVHHVRKSCLFDHSPSPQRCARLGGVWDDSSAVAEEKGGVCLTQKEAERRLARGVGRIEAVEIHLSSDNNLTAFTAPGVEAPDTIQCIRPVDVEKAHRTAMLYYGAYCAADVDMEDLEELMLSEEFEAEQEAVLQAEEDSRSKRLKGGGHLRVGHELKPPKPPPRGDPNHKASFRRRLPAHILSQAPYSQELVDDRQEL